MILLGVKKNAYMVLVRKERGNNIKLSNFSCIKISQDITALVLLLVQGMRFADCSGMDTPPTTSLF